MKTARTFIFAFVFGLIIGGFSVWLYTACSFAGMVTSVDQIAGLHYRCEWLERGYQAYFYEDPEVAVWALENVEKILKHDAGKIQFADDQKTIFTDLTLNHVRLALLYNRLEEPVKYQENLNCALDLSTKYCRDDWHTEEALLSIVNKLDESNRNKSNEQ